MHGNLGFLGRCTVLACSAFLPSAFTVGQKPTWNEADFPRFMMKLGATDVEGLPTSGAKLCLLPQKAVCYQMPPESARSTPNVSYIFGLEPRAERRQLAGGGSWMFFSAVFSGGGSGTLTRFALLRANHGRLTNLLPYVAATNVSETALWDIPSISVYPVLVQADFFWDLDAGETHFSEHRYDVSGWKFNPSSDRYVKVFSYRTAGKYEGGDAGSIRVLEPEREHILRRF